MNPFPMIGCGLLGAGVVFFLMPFILRMAHARGWSRRWEAHHTDHAWVPRLGGVALAGAFVVIEAMIAWLNPGRSHSLTGGRVLILSTLSMFAIGLCDDLRPLGARRKLLGQILVALYVHYGGFGIEELKLPFAGHIFALHGWGVFFTVGWLVGLTNLVNLIDGVDGLAGGIALMLMSLLLYMAEQNGTFVLLTAGATGALLGFLFFNFPPARVYLGDGGAYLLGFQIGIFSLAGSQKGTVVAALMAPLFVLALPMVDVSVAILRRGLRGLPLLRPDRRHLHHKLLAAGMSRRRVVLAFYGVTLVFLVMGFGVFWSEGRLLPVLFGAAVLVLLLCAGQLSFAREWLAVGRTLGNSLAMRRQIHYTLALMGWFRHEGERCASLDELFHDFVFAARRLGFISVRLIIGEEERVWRGEPNCARTKVHRQELQAPWRGLLELTAPVCFQSPSVCPPENCAACSKSVNSGIEFDPRLFEITCELAVENWAKAVASYARRFDRAPLKPSPPGAGSHSAQRHQTRDLPIVTARRNTLAEDGSGK